MNINLQDIFDDILITVVIKKVNTMTNNIIAIALDFFLRFSMNFACFSFSIFIFLLSCIKLATPSYILYIDNLSIRKKVNTKNKYKIEYMNSLFA
tara:strand:- start:707 stop:991 length:285 start_codon:yes stop_codon:yes gene_type:complete